MTKILIVDDESKNLYLLQALLSSNGYELESASNGAEALELALRTKPDVIISDILMPVMDGFSLCRACKEDERLRDIPFIFYTATYTDPKDEALAFSLGAERFMVKPTEPAQFLALLKETVEKFATGKGAAQHGTVEDEEYYKKYNAVLTSKLEDKVAELEEKNHKLEADNEERKKAEEKIRQQTSRAEALARTAFNINSKLDLNAVLSSICKETANALAAPAVSLRMVDPGNQTISVVADYGLPPILRERSVQIPLSVFPSQLSPASDTPIIIPDAKAVPQLPNADLFQLLNLCSIVSVKIKHKDTFIGSLSVFSVDNVRQFSEDEIALLEELSNQAAQAITNAHLFENTERQLKNIEALHTIDNAIANSMDIGLTLRVVTEETIRQLGVDAADILLYKPSSNLLETTISQGFRTPSMQKVTLSIGEGLAGQIASDWQRIFIPDMADYRSKSTRASIFTGEDFVTYCGMPLRAKGQFIGVLEVFNRTRLNPDPDWFSFLETLAGQAAIAIDRIKSFEEIQISNTKLIMAYDATIEGWSQAMDLRDEETEGHTQRVAQQTIQLASRMGISDEQIVHIRRGALLHDMGKLGVPDRILLKPGKLADEEWAIMRKHPQYVYDMLSSIDYLRPALDIPYCHHEKWDGSGYPRGLKGEEIPLAARIFAVIDVWDALTSNRPYRKAWSQEQTLEYIRELAGTHFDPQVVKTFLESIETT